MSVPDFASVDPAAMALSVAALLAAFRFKLGVASLLAGAVGLGRVFGAVGWIAG